MIKKLNTLILQEISEIRRCRTQALTFADMAFGTGNDNLELVADSYWIECARHGGKLLAYRHVRKLLRASEKTSALDRAKSLMPDWPARHPDRSRTPGTFPENS